MPYNDGSRRLQDRFDTRRLTDRIDERTVDEKIDEDDREFIEGVPREQCSTPVPAWKTREWARDVLRRDDPAHDPGVEVVER